MEKRDLDKGFDSRNMKETNQKNGLDIDLTSIVKYVQQCKNEVCINRNGYPSFMFSLKTPLYTYPFI